MDITYNADIILLKRFMREIVFCQVGERTSRNCVDLDCRSVCNKLAKYIELNGRGSASTELVRINQQDGYTICHWIVKWNKDGHAVVVDPTILQFYLHAMDEGDLTGLRQLWCNMRPDIAIPIIYKNEDARRIQSLVLNCEMYNIFKQNIANTPYFIGNKEDHPLHKFF